MKKSLSDTFKLSNGVKIPCVGFGTYKMPEGKTAYDAVKFAIETGYRHIDTAAFYENEKSVGKAIADSGIERKKMFVTTKLWNTDRGYDSALRAFDKSMANLGMDYIDLYLIHWPDAKSGGDARNIETWRAFERLYKEGRVRAIGVSNFKVHHLRPLIETAEIKPMVNQIEYHPGQTQPDVVKFCRKNKILVEAWSPLGRGKMLEDAQLKDITLEYGISVAQLCLSWCLQNRVLPLPKSVTPERIVENSRIFGFEVAPSDIEKINDMSYFGGSGLDPDKVDF